MAKRHKNFNWGPISDIMSGLMILFLFIAIAFIMMQKQQAAAYGQNQQDIYDKLTNALAPLIESNIISVNEKLTVTFDPAIVYFLPNQSDILPEFKRRLDNFIPIYIAALRQWDRDNPNKIAEIRVEGHTSSIWNDFTAKEESYYKNMQLSQDRSRSVVRYTMAKYSGTPEWDWLKTYVTANGLSSSKIISNANGSENRENSMRVEFKIRLDSDAALSNLAGGS